MTPIEKARGRIAIRQVFFAALMFNIPLVERHDIPTAATDMKSIFYNPKFIEKLNDVDLTIFVLLHELCHIILMHGLRRGTRDPELWNIAADHAVNLMLQEAQIKIWPKAYCDAQYKGLSTEQIYDNLLQEEKNGGGRGRGRGRQGGSGDDQSNPMPGDILEPRGDDQAKAEIQRQIMGKVAQAATQAQLAGQMPAHLRKLVDGLLRPEIEWEQALAEYMQRFVKEDENWGRRNRRFEKFYLPARWSPALGELVIIGDTSGSIYGCEGYYKRIAGELNYIVGTLKPERVRMIWADDDECSLQQVFEPGDEIILTPQGGGGTDMRRPLSFVEQYAPLVVVLVTDGLTPWPESTPYPLLVLCTTNVVAPIGTTIKITT